MPEGEEDEPADDQRIEFDLRFLIPAAPKEKDRGGKHHQPEDPKPDRKNLPGIDDGNQEEKEKKKGGISAAFSERPLPDPTYEVTSSETLTRVFMIVDLPDIESRIGVDIADGARREVRCGHREVRRVSRPKRSARRLAL